MLDLLGTFFSSIISGGMTGILGVVVQRIADYKNKQLDIEMNREKMAHEVALRQVDHQIVSQEWVGRTTVAQIEADGREAVADSQAFAASFNEPQRYSDAVKPSRKQAWLLVVLDFIRGLVRPGLTIYLCILTTLVYYHARTLITDKPIDPAYATELVKMIVGTILYLTTTCLLWWFGVRNKAQGPKYF